jgi:hypothetical protein
VLRILHLSDQNWVGAASTFVKYHNNLGNYAQLVTLARSENEFDSGICLELPFATGNLVNSTLRAAVNLIHGHAPKYRHIDERRVWIRRSALEAWLFALRDRLWAKKINAAIDRYHLLDFDIYHLEGGGGFFRDSRIIKRLRAMGKKLVCYYLGTDLRDTGVIPEIDKLCGLRITTEFDHLALHPDLRFSFLPFEVDNFEVRRGENRRLRICHAPRNRFFKGTEAIVQVCRRIEQRHNVELVLIEGKSNREAIEIKKTCDLAIDQIGNRGGTGYGMNSLETLSLGIPTVTEFTPEFAGFLPDHPFVLVTEDTLQSKLELLISDPDLRRRKALEGRRFVEKYHRAETVVSSIYAMYEEMGWIDDRGNVPSTATG